MKMLNVLLFAVLMFCGCHKNTVKLPGGETVQMAPGTVCRDIDFQAGRTNLTGKGFAQMVEAISIVRNTPGNIVVEGQDSPAVGVNIVKSIEVARARANTVVGYLLEYGIAGGRVRVETAISRNNRVVIKSDVNNKN